nr:pyruvate kinase [Anaerolineae bacterium]
MIRTKIVCTIGPASRDIPMLAAMLRAGMNVARLNLSHGILDEHAVTIDNIRKASKETGVPVAIMADLQGPKIRVGLMRDGGVSIKTGETILITTSDVEGHRVEVEDDPVRAVIPVQYKKLPDDVVPGERILIDDGLIGLRIESVTDTGIVCRVVNGGVVGNRKGLNLPDTRLSIPSISEKDFADMVFAIEQRVDWLALSFVRHADDIRQLRDQIEQQGAGCPVKVLAKIEKPQALDFIVEIIEVADGIMVARGDLGIEIAAEGVPMVQKRLIRLANEAGKPVITATQMLDSMIRNPRPTRAEASDVANAILDGTDAIMLSGETSVGSYPLEAVSTMVRIANEIESATLQGPWLAPNHIEHFGDVTDAVSHATCETAYHLRAQAIIASTASGTTAKTIAKYRPHALLIAMTPDPVVQRQLLLTWGVIPLLCSEARNTDEMVRNAVSKALKVNLIEAGKRVVITAGVTPNMPGTTNLMQVELVTPESG